MRCRRFVDGCSTPSRSGPTTLRGMGRREARRVLWPIEWRIHTRKFRQQIGCRRNQSSASSGAPMAEAARFGQRGDDGRSHVGALGRSADAETRAHRIIQPNNGSPQQKQSAQIRTGSLVSELLNLPPPVVGCARMPPSPPGTVTANQGTPAASPATALCASPARRWPWPRVVEKISLRNVDADDANVVHGRFP